MTQETIMSIIGIVIRLAILALVIVAVVRIVKRIRQSIQKAKSAMRQISNVVDTLKATDEEQMHTPKSLSAVQSIYVPQLKEDFPEFNPDVAKTYIKSFIVEYFAALEEHKTDLRCFEDTCSRQFIELLAVKCADTTATTYSQVLVHKIVISDYKKDNDEANVHFQLALQYIPSNTNRLTQEKYTVTYSYFLESGAQGELASVICSHCGAPIHTLGAKVCPYCDAAVAAVAVDRRWKVTDVKRTTY